MFASQTQKYARCITLVLLLGFGWHIVSIHGFMGSLIYCFGPNGDVKVEAYCDAQTSVSSPINHSLQTVENLEGDHLQAGHWDVTVSEICPEIRMSFGLGHLPVPKLNLLTRDGIITGIGSALLGIRRWSIYRPPTIKQPILSDLQTVVLLN